MTGRLALALVVAGCTSDGVYTDPAAHGVDRDAPAATANCQLPEGPVHAYTSAAEIATLVVGQWIRCSGPPLLADGDQDLGIEIDVDRTYYRLASDGAGGIVRLTGFANQGTWKVWTVYQPSGNVLLFGLTSTANLEISSVPAFEDSPRRLAASTDNRGDLSIYAIAP